MVHRPDLSLQRLTPTSHDELLFDDVLWVERAQLEHDRFVAQMRGRGVEVFLLHELLAETLAASEPARQRLIELVVSEYTVGLSLGRRGARAARRLPARRARQAPHRRPDRRRGGTRPGDAGRLVTDRRRTRRPVDVRAAPAPQHPVHPGLVVLDLRRRVGQPDVLAGPPPRGVQRGGDLQGPPDVRRRRLRVLVSAREAPTAGWRRPTSGSRRWRVAT